MITNIDRSVKQDLVLGLTRGAAGRGCLAVAAAGAASSRAAAGSGPATKCSRFAVLSRDSRFGQRIAHALTVEIGDRLMDSLVECGGVGEGLMGEVKCLEIVPDDLDGV
jgi:hypothetical protein